MSSAATKEQLHVVCLCPFRVDHRSEVSSERLFSFHHELHKHSFQLEFVRPRNLKFGASEMKLGAVTVVLLKNSWLRAEKNLSQRNINFYNERDEKRIGSVFWFIFTLD